MRGDLLILLSNGTVILCIARYLLQWAGLDTNHSLARFCIQATDWLVKPIRKLVPSQGKWDVARILAGLLFYYVVFILIWLMTSSEGLNGRVITVNLIFAVLALMKAAAYVLFIGLFVHMVLSIKKPYSPVSVLLQRISESVLRPFVFLRDGRYNSPGSVLALALWFWLGYILPQLFRMLNLWLLQQCFKYTGKRKQNEKSVNWYKKHRISCKTCYYASSLMIADFKKFINNKHLRNFR